MSSSAQEKETPTRKPPPHKRNTVVVWTMLLRKTHEKYVREAEKKGMRLAAVLREKLEPSSR